MERNPATHVRRPRVDNESRTLGLDRNELSAFMVQAGISTQREHALASLLVLNGLRVSEALNADIDDLGFERGQPKGWQALEEPTDRNPRRYGNTRNAHPNH